MTEKIIIITSFIKSILKKNDKNKLVIGISGGIDSAVSLTLATQSIGKENVYPFLLPYGDQDILDAMEICRFNQIPTGNIKMINIKKNVDTIRNEIEEQCHSDPNGIRAQNQIQKNDSKAGLQPAQNDAEFKVRIGNIMARVRMIMIFDQAKKLGALVCGTENKSEKYLGYFTRFGDEASDLEPLQHLYKTQVWRLAKELKLPQKFIDKQPSAGLWDGQSDEQELGFSYAQADLVLVQLIDKNIKAKEIEINGMEQKIIDKVIKQVKSQHFKHEVPYRLE